MFISYAKIYSRIIDSSSLSLSVTHIGKLKLLPLKGTEFIPNIAALKSIKLMAAIFITGKKDIRSNQEAPMAIKGLTACYLFMSRLGIPIQSVLIIC